MNLVQAIARCRPDAQWTLKGNALDGLQWIGPGEAPTLQECETAWTEILPCKIWLNVQQFMASFTMEEKAAVSMSQDPTIAALRLELSTWFSDVHANDPRVVMGLDKLVELGIITPERKAEIITV